MPLHRNPTEDQYLTWLFQQAEAAQPLLETLMNRALHLLNDSTRTMEIAEKIQSEDGRIPQVIATFVSKFDTKVHCRLADLCNPQPNINTATVQALGQAVSAAGFDPYQPASAAL